MDDREWKMDVERVVTRHWKRLTQYVVFEDIRQHLVYQGLATGFEMRKLDDNRYTNEEIINILLTNVLEFNREEYGKFLRILRIVNKHDLAECLTIMDPPHATPKDRRTTQDNESKESMSDISLLSQPDPSTSVSADQDTNYLRMSSDDGEADTDLLADQHTTDKGSSPAEHMNAHAADADKTLSPTQKEIIKEVTSVYFQRMTDRLEAEREYFDDKKKELLEEHITELEKKENELKKVQEQLKLTEEEVNTLKKQNSEIESQLSVMKRQPAYDKLSKLQSKLENLRHKEGELIEEKRKLTLEIRSLRNDENRKDKESKKQDVKLKKLQENIKQLNSEITRLRNVQHGPGPLKARIAQLEKEKEEWEREKKNIEGHKRAILARRQKDK